MLDQLQAAPALIDQVHDQLAAAIASGELAPRQRITQESVATLLGVSRQPVSHALQILKRRGLLIEHGKRGLAVAPLQRDRIMGLYQIREVLDGLAASLAAKHCRDRSAAAADIAALEQALSQGEELMKTNEIGKLVIADVAFHACIHKLSGNAEIARTVAEQWPQFMRSMGFVLSAADRSQSIWSEHRAITAAVLSGKPDEAESFARSHAHNAAQQAATELPNIEITEVAE